MKRTKLLPLLLSALLLLSASGCRPAEAPSQSGGASSSVSSSTSSSGIPAPNDEILPIDLAVLSGPTGVGAAYLMEYYAPEHVPADSPISVSSVVVTENSEATALLSNGEADIAAVATNVASNFYHKTDGSIQMLAVNTMGVLYILEKGDSIQSMADLQGKTIYATGQGANPEYILNYLLTQNGLDPAVDVTIQWLTAHADALKSSYPSAYEPWDYEALTMETNRITLLHNPIHASNKEPWMWETVCHLMGTGKEITVYTPYIICGKEMYADLTALCKKTDLVEIITNDVASGANPWGCTDYLNQKKKIWATGVRVYEYLGEHSSHSKAVLIDDRMSIVGSYNMDMRSTYQDTELMLAVDSPELNAVIRKEAEVNKTYSRYMTPEGTYINGENYVPREMSAGKKLFYGVLRVLIMPFRRFL